MSAGEILYPVALLANGVLTSIREWDGASEVFCPGCTARFVGRRGEIVQWHFAHRQEAGAFCSGETALHAAAKIAIAQGFSQAKADNKPYTAAWTEACGHRRSVDLARWCERAETEKRLCDDTRTDVALRGPRPVAVEVVVRHAPEQETLERYADASIPVLTVRPEWADVPGFLGALPVERAIGVRPFRCEECRVARERKEAAEHETRKRRERMEREFAARMMPSERSPAPQPWYTDRFGGEVFSNKRQELMRQARRCRVLGFRQHLPDSPWLFSRPFESGRVYADMGGTRIVPIWSDPRPMVYWHRVSPTRLGLELLFSWLQRAGIDFRVSGEADPEVQCVYGEVMGSAAQQG